MGSMSTFQLVVIALFVTFILFGVGAFALFGGVFGGGSVGSVVIWGTLEQDQAEYLLEAMRTQNDALQDVNYVEQDPRTYEQDLLNAMASGQSPDLFLVSETQLGAFEDKILAIPYSYVSQSEFVSSYIDEGQMFLVPNGSLALPFLVDPLVMYWNRDLFGTAGVAKAPEHWNDFLELAPKINAFDNRQNISRSVVALGAYQNVTHAKEILSTLMMQAGDPIVARTAQGKLVPTLGQNTSGTNPAESALRFYTEFSNPSKTTYSWNRALPESKEAFVGGQLAVYFGFASELAEIEDRNPNLRVGVAKMPQLQGAGAEMTYGRLTGLAVPRASRNVAGAAAVAKILTSQSALNVLAIYNRLPAARRDVGLSVADNAAADVFQRSALIARGWVDPSSAKTDDLFKVMIESVISGKNEPAGAVGEAAVELSALLPSAF